ncbi:unnamed protein product [Brachionus calyciflorus]|uniref:DNA repair protein SWI5 homolog n=1 Tax=Brachionus calyciflorus TaxID=104777 RepID=A0A813S4W2_9BILA|nr:unnamed protein product [Brachionus calyciflorus]
MSKLQDKKRTISNSSELEQQSDSKKPKSDDVNNSIIKYMPMKNASKNLNKSFKSPFTHKSESNKLEISTETKINNQLNSKSIQQQQQQIDEIDREINKLEQEGINSDELDVIIDKLHVYNDIKDTAQSLLERIAHLKGFTIKKMHEIYNLDPLND